ncbi:MAG: sigma-54 dependent transcriptional regulator [Desulfonauticus sp.]|nr:sigma-54 dependent transcriptional regulator [Desulfonauticus sp.]
MSGKILAVDDEIDMLNLLKRIIETKTRYEIEIISQPEKVMKFIENEYIDLILLDLRMPGINGLELLKQIKNKDPEIGIIIITAYGTVESSVEAMKMGAFDFVLKPFQQEELLLTIHRAMDIQKLKKENRILKEELKKEKETDFIIGQSPTMQSIYKTILQVAKSEASIVITGETGTGKELIARSIHKHSLRKGNFVALNCSAVPENLIESELFGHVKGSFSGALTNKKGLIEEAEGGTLFLDEVGDLSELMQTKLLRFLQEGEFRPVGGTKSKKINVRIVAATNKNLEDMVKQGKFRKDLYYRLNVIHLHLPPLRERKDAIPILAHHFLEKYNAINNKQIHGFSKEALNYLLTQDWPGNVRELENVVERAVILCQDKYIKLEHIEPLNNLKEQTSLEEILSLPFKQARKKILQEFYYNYLKHILSQTQGNISKAANLCGIKRQYFYRLLKIAGLDNKLKN